MCLRAGARHQLPIVGRRRWPPTPLLPTAHRAQQPDKGVGDQQRPLWYISSKIGNAPPSILRPRSKIFLLREGTTPFPVCLRCSSVRPAPTLRQGHRPQGLRGCGGREGGRQREGLACAPSAHTFHSTSSADNLRSVCSSSAVCLTKSTKPCSATRTARLCPSKRPANSAFAA